MVSKYEKGAIDALLALRSGRSKKGGASIHIASIRAFYKHHADKLAVGWQRRLRGRLIKLAEEGKVWSDDHYLRFGLVSKIAKAWKEPPSTQGIKSELIRLKREFRALQKKYNAIQGAAPPTPEPISMEAPSVTMTTSEVSGPRFEVMEHGEEFVPETPLSMELPARPYDVELGEEPPPSPVSETYYEAPELIEPTSPTTPQGGQSAQQRSAFENNVDQLREKEAQLQDVSAQLRALQSQLEKEQHRILELERQNEEERREHEEQQRTLVSQQADRALRLEGELNEAQRDLERASTETTQELHKTQAELEELKERESELTLELENLRSVETQRQREARELASDLSRLKAEYDQLLGQKRQMESDRNRADEENTRLEQWKSGAESQLARYSRGIRDFVSHSREKNS